MRCTLVVALLALGACSDRVPTAPSDPGTTPSLAAGRGFGSSATMTFGIAGVGTSFDPAIGHDRSSHAYDKIRPASVQIEAGGSVTFEVGPFHQVTIYETGTVPADINIGLVEDLTAPFPIPDFLINDPNGRVAANQLTTALSFIPTTWTSPAGTFDAPGRYLVICRVFPHFVFSHMYGWVNVK